MHEHITQCDFHALCHVWPQENREDCHDEEYIIKIYWPCLNADVGPKDQNINEDFEYQDTEFRNTEN